MAQYKSLGEAFRKIGKQVDQAKRKAKSQVASAINRELTATRKDIVEVLISRTELKRKILNDRLSISRANPSDDVLSGEITPLYGKRLYMTDYPYEFTKARNGKTVIRLTSQIYRKNMRTGFLSADKKRMYMRILNDNGTTSSVRAVRGRTIPRMFDEFKMKERFEGPLYKRIADLAKSTYEYLLNNLS